MSLGTCCSIPGCLVFCGGLWFVWFWFFTILGIWLFVWRLVLFRFWGYSDGSLAFPFSLLSIFRAHPFCMLALHSRSLHLWFSFSPSFGSTTGKNFQPYLLTQKRRLNSQLYRLPMTLCLVLTVSREGWISSFSVFWWRAVLFRQWAEELSLKHYSLFLPLFKCISIYFK